MSRPKLADNIYLIDDDRSIAIIDQSRLPAEEVICELSSVGEMVDAIKTLKVRGAPAIGIFAGYCMYVLARRLMDDDREMSRAQFAEAMEEYSEALNASRPTAVNLSRALKRVHQRMRGFDGTLPELVSAIGDEAEAIQWEDVGMCRRIAANGLSLLRDGDGILTHCNAGPLATSRFGTALGPVLMGHEKGYSFHVYADETRPLLQGARLTTYELQKAGVDVTLICDNMASMVMKNGWIQACLVGCDRVAANGDTANKIGTSGVAVLAKHYGIPFYVLGPGSTIDMNCPTGEDIVIEQRDPAEVRGDAAPADVDCYNPAFDVTDHALITAIVTEKGICYPPFKDSLDKLFGKPEEKR